ncbi:MAG: DUF2085 domain-containing protein [Terriglobales bacterium]
MNLAIRRAQIASASQQHVLAGAVPAFLSAAALSAPLLAATGFSLSAFAILHFSSVVCHQDPARSFWIAGAPVAVCTRCLGIYLGAVAGLLASVSRLTVVRFLTAAAVVNLLDYYTESAGLHGNWPLLRFALGGILGAGLGALVAASMPRSSPAGS